MSTFIIVPLSSNLLKLSALIKDDKPVKIEVTASTTKATSLLIGEDILLLDRLEIFQNYVIPLGEYTLTADIEGQFVLEALSSKEKYNVKMAAAGAPDFNPKLGNF